MDVTNTAASATQAATPKTGSNALGSLANNFDDFLKLLMTQLQNQDPTSPMDTNQFTNQLVQFSSVEQQINTNTSLNKLIQATQGTNLLQSSSLIGQNIEVASDQLSLQGGAGAVRFQTTGAESVKIGVYSEAGVKLHEANVASKPGANTWSWDGIDDTGRQLPDGAYRVMAIKDDGSALPFTVVGEATGVQRSSDAMKVQLGGLNVDFNKVQSVGTN